MRFEDQAKEIAKQFLLTAVVIDDEAEFSMPDPPVAVVVEPGGDVGLNAAIDAAPAAPIRQANRLNAKELVDSFGDLNLFCAVLKPLSSEEALGGRTLELAKRADLIVVDWSLMGDDGQTTLDLIAKIIEPLQEPAQYRVLAVYTAERLLVEVANKIRNRLASHGLELTPRGTLGVEFVREHTLIAVYAKENINPAPELHVRKKRPRDLPSALVTDFASITCGLLTSVVLASLGRVRSHTHRILAKFDRRLDAAYLGHRALLATPAEAEEHVTPLITAEIESLLDDESVLKAVRLASLTSYVKEAQQAGFLTEEMSQLPAEEHLAFLEAALRDGMVSAAFKSKYAGVTLVKNMDNNDGTTGLAAVMRLANLFRQDGENDDNPHLELAVLMSVRTIYNSSAPPVLGPGVVVSQGAGASPKLWMCVQPICDSVRLRQKRRFDFLRLTRENNKFGYVLADGGAYLRLKLSKKLYDGYSATFLPNSSRQLVLAKKEGVTQSWEFETAEGHKLRYMCTLKGEHTMRVMERLTTDLGRVGLTESEWLRRNSP